MSDPHLGPLVDQLIRYWTDPERQADPAAQTCRVLAQRITRLLPADRAAEIARAPAEHRDLIEAALHRLAERDPATRDLLVQPTPPGDLDGGAAPAAAIPAAAVLTSPPPPPGRAITEADPATAERSSVVFHLGSGVQVQGDFSGNLSGATFGAVPPAASPTPALAAAAAPAPAPVASATILFVGVNPADGTRLRLDEEVRQIDAALGRGSLRDRFTLHQIWAARMLDLQQGLLQRAPQILHFSGHGSTAEAIYLENDDGSSLAIGGPLLASLLGSFSQSLRCVVLNACYSEAQARAVAQQIDCVVGMKTAVGDAAAIRFSAAFYQALAFGANIQTAFDLGCLHIQPTAPNEATTPQLLALRRQPREIFLGLTP